VSSSSAGRTGLLSTLGILTGLAGAAVGTTAIVVAGIATAAVGALSMGTGAWLASRAENQLFASEIEREECAFCDRPDLASRELAVLLRDQGLDDKAARAVAECLCTSRNAAVKTMVEKRLGLAYGDVETAWGDAGVVAASFVAGALVPLAPYLVLDVDLAVPLSVLLTGVALFALGVAKGRVARLAPVRSGIEVLLVGGLAAGIGYLIGSLAQLG
jgi:VIT1/CCC1 family predicted Fe2+/Mn2+ transporter